MIQKLGNTYIYYELKLLCQMKVMIVVLIVLIITFYFYKFILNRTKRVEYLKAGKKWEEIVNELSKRK